MRKFFSALTFSAAMLGAAPASAAIVTATYEGTVVSSYDSLGRFGLVDTEFGTAYVDLPMRIEFIFDTSLGNSNFGPNTSSAWGGLAYNVTSPMLSAKVTLNGIDFFGNVGAMSDIIRAFHQGSIGHQQHINEWMQDTSLYGTMQEQILGQFTAAANSIPSLFYTPFSINSTRYHTGEMSYYYNDLMTNIYIVATVDRLSVSAVPEPATWAMMLIGFAGLGFAARRRKEALAG